MNRDNYEIGECIGTVFNIEEPVCDVLCPNETAREKLIHMLDGGHHAHAVRSDTIWMYSSYAKELIELGVLRVGR